MADGVTPLVNQSLDVSGIRARFRRFDKTSMAISHWFIWIAPLAQA